jgi:multidrug efflux pump subunit AcrA (membrane-fusion protein)
MLRVFLIVAVAAGLAAAVVGYTRVGGKITGLNTELTSTKTQRDQLLASETKLRRELRTANESLASTTAELADTKADLEFTQTRAAQQEVRANQLELERTTYLRERNEAQTELAIWRAFNRTPDEIRALIAENRRLVDENLAVSEENRVLARRLDSTQNRLAMYEGRQEKVALRRDLRGEVIAVDPKYDFVVLNIGENDGVLERGEMLVNRAGKLVAKVRVLSVEPQSSVANVLPDWRQADIMEGDAVMVGN